MKKSGIGHSRSGLKKYTEPPVLPLPLGPLSKGHQGASLCPIHVPSFPFHLPLCSMSWLSVCGSGWACFPLGGWEGWDPLVLVAFSLSSPTASLLGTSSCFHRPPPATPSNAVPFTTCGFEPLRCGWSQMGWAISKMDN